ncbi:hypothetical protein LfeInf_121 [Lactobacillus phage LfeInf]|uniref:Uncharacterized protein n=1 Tax=Lactobacillus phage LfeInf TaxID=1567484 RepID=A0A0A7NU68_9CAUD|nr:hypothetical protein AXJ15_gp041 [Lactobacillus phage LfeInf]AIZ94747.1 hypothetical protein LfeInf_121 [Lactobacillus phage LfeInf]
MNKQTNNGAIDTLLKRSWDMGLDFIDEGKFESNKELGALFDSVYPWEIDDKEKAELVQELLDNGYIEPSPDDEEIDSLQIVDNHLYTHYRDLTMMDICNYLIYDKCRKDYLLGFDAFGSYEITGAIDLATGSIGYYNSEYDVYTQVGTLWENDVTKLERVVNDYDFSIDCTCKVARN